VAIDKAIRAATRLAFSLVIFAAAMPMSSVEAEAKRGITVRTINSAASDRHPDEETEKSSGEVAPAEEAVSSEPDVEAAPQTPPETVARAQAVTMAKKPASPAVFVERVVPGCSPGMACTVCLAGCNGAVNVIVHTAPANGQKN
jgi:hypothetical protein